MSKKALKVLGITALLGLIGFLAYKHFKKCDTQTPNEENVTSSGSLGTNQYTSSGSLGTNPYGSSGGLGTNPYGSGALGTNNLYLFSPSQFESFPTGLIYSYFEKDNYSSDSTGTWRHIYKSAIGTSQYNNKWW
jgi:hypothetical protein